MPNIWKISLKNNWPNGYPAMRIKITITIPMLSWQITWPTAAVTAMAPQHQHHLHRELHHPHWTMADAKVIVQLYSVWIQTVMAVTRRLIARAVGVYVTIMMMGAIRRSGKGSKPNRVRLLKKISIYSWKYYRKYSIMPICNRMENNNNLSSK